MLFVCDIFGRLSRAYYHIMSRVELGNMGLLGLKASWLLVLYMAFAEVSFIIVVFWARGRGGIARMVGCWLGWMPSEARGQ